MTFVGGLYFVGKSVSRIYKRVLRRQLREAGMPPKRYRRSVHRAYRTLGVFP